MRGINLKNGFSLIELLAALVILGVLAALAIPSYNAHTLTTRRTDGQIALLNLAAGMERYYTTNNSYNGATLTLVGSPSTSPDGKYALAIATANATSFEITAAPQGTQTDDTTCGTLAMNNLGQKGRMASGSFTVDANCW